MTTIVFIYIALSLLASIAIYGACIVAAYADRVMHSRNKQTRTKSKRKEPLEREPPRE